MNDTRSCSFAAVALGAVLLAACHDPSSSGPPAPSAAPLAPMGMSSAANLVATGSPVEVLAKLHRPKEAVLGGGALLVLDTPTDSPDTGEGLDVVSVATAPGGSPKVLFSHQRGAEGLAFAGGRLVWITAPSDDGKEHSKIVSAKVGAAAPTPVARTLDTDETLAVSDGTDAFSLGDKKDSPKAKSSSPDVLRIGGDGKAAVVTTTAGALVRTAMAVNATHVFWVQGGAIVRAPKAGGDAASVVKPPTGKIQRMAADDTSVYWTDSGTGDPQWSGRVYRASLADGKVETLSDAPSPFAIAVDADAVYWTSSADVGGRVMARKKNGKETYVLANEQHGPRGLAVDGTYVYWVNTADGNVCRVAKATKASP